MSRRWICGGAAAVLVLGSVLVLAPSASAVSVTDEATFRAAWGTADTIDLSNDIALSTCGNGVNAGDANRNSATNLTLDGHGHSITQTCALGSQNGVLDATGTGAVTVKNVTITGGNTTDTCGGGVHYDGPGGLSVLNAIVTNNHSNGVAGGVCGDGAALTITDSRLTGNSTAGFGGAATSDDSITITRSTLANNAGNGVVGTDGLVTLRDSTVSGNTNNGALGTGGGATVINSTIANNASGAISTGGPITLVYATIVDNGSGDSFQIEGPTLTSFGSVVALSKGGIPNCSVRTTTSNGYNFSDDATCGFTATGDRQSAGDPGLGALANNGGTTETRKPTGTSPLVNFIPPASCKDDGASSITGDQVGTNRPQGDGCEIGAFEIPVAPPPAPEAPPAEAVAAQAQLTG